MASGQQIARQNVAKFEAWLCERSASDDWTDYARGSQLNRKEIAAECGFAVSVLRQNPAIKDLLQDAEERLRKRGVLNQASGDLESLAASQRASQGHSRDKSRIKQLEEQNAAHKARIAALENTLKKYELFEEHLSETGRALPR